jgi:hypothetical protein
MENNPEISIEMQEEYSDIFQVLSCHGTVSVVKRNLTSQLQSLACCDQDYPLFPLEALSVPVCRHVNELYDYIQQ